PADANAFQNLAFELGLSDAGSIVYDGELTHQKAAEILAERIAQKEGDPRVATLFKREVFDQALVCEEPLTDWNAKAIKDSIEVAKTKITSSSDLLSEKVQRFGKEILERDLNQWVKDAPVGENRAEAADRIVLCLEQK